MPSLWNGNTATDEYMDMSWTWTRIGAMHEENIMGNTPKTPPASPPLAPLKVGIPLVKINTFHRFKYR